MVLPKYIAIASYLVYGINHYILYSKKLWWEKSLANKNHRKFGGKIFGKLKAICVGKVMEIMKVSNLVNFCNSPNFPVFYRQCFLLYSVCTYIYIYIYINIYIYTYIFLTVYSQLHFTLTVIVLM